MVSYHDNLNIMTTEEILKKNVSGNSISCKGTERMKRYTMQTIGVDGTIVYNLIDRETGDIRDSFDNYQSAILFLNDWNRTDEYLKAEVDC